MNASFLGKLAFFLPVWLMVRSNFPNSVGDANHTLTAIADVLRVANGLSGDPLVRSQPLRKVISVERKQR